ncbi:MAG TPA: type VI secretion system baseplate subunit TssG [Terracidiphilus sp.]|jgi:type VI secretion system protein ImpH
MATKIGTSPSGLTPTSRPMQPSGLTDITKLPVTGDESQETALESSSLGMDLHDDAPSFEFFQAVALLQRMQSDRRPVGHFFSPEDETVRFHVNPRMGFPASEVQELQVHKDAPADMMVNFMGLTGPQGVLPYVYSEQLLERLRAKDRSLASFLDIFNHRAISLFYRAWQRTRFPVNYASGSLDFFSQYLRDLLGIGTAGLSDRQRLEDEALMHYIGLVAMQSRSAVALEQILADYFEVPIEIEQFTGAWYSLDQSTQCAMNEKDSMSTQMGAGAVVGDAVWDRGGRVRIRIGPISLQRYDDFLPGGSANASLRAITRFFSNGCMDFEAQLVLDRREVPPVELDFDARHPARLGWVSWARTAPMGADPDDTILAV